MWAAKAKRGANDDHHDLGHHDHHEHHDRHHDDHDYFKFNSNTQSILYLEFCLGSTVQMHLCGKGSPPQIDNPGIWALPK